MADELVYDTLGQTPAGNDGSLSYGGSVSFSFTSAATASTLTDVKVSLVDGSATTDQGSVSVYLLSDASNAPGAIIANLGTIDDSQIDSRGSTILDFPVTANVPLTASTRYWIKLVGSSTSGANFDYEADASGSGAQNEFFEDGDGPIQSNAAEGAFIAQVSEAPCFVNGTRIRTVAGDVAVEKLAIGEGVLNAAGTVRAIAWLGHRTVDCRSHPHPREVMPIKIFQHAFGENRPARDLYVSPGHSICVRMLDEVLVPAGALVNGTTIVQVDVDTVTYWHVELDTHDILLAENLPAESYLEMGNRGFFAEADVVAFSAPPDAPMRTHADFCRPFHADGLVIDAVRARLSAIADGIFKANNGGQRVGAVSPGLHSQVSAHST